MSDTMEELSKQYEEDVLFDLSSSNSGPYPTPEYPSLTLERGMWSSALDVILTTLRYLAPATLLTLLWGQQSFLFKLLKHVDKAFRALVYSSEEQKRDVLNWVSAAGGVRIEHLDTIWRHGWIMCAVLDAALPGACAGHPPTRLSLRHAQAIADHYLGVEPVFSRQELESSDSLSRNQEWKLATYLNRIRQALSQLTPPVSRPASLRTSPDTTQFTKDYIARGSGLTAAQINNKMKFKIYPTAQQCLDPGEIAVLIKGPKDTYGMTIIPPILGKAQLIRQKLLGLQVAPSYTESILPITQGATYLRNFGKNQMSKTYFIPKIHYDIEVEFDCCEDHASVSYTVKMEGRYEISITSRGHSILGSPFQVTASHNRLAMLEKESFCLEDGEEIDIVDVPTDRKVILRIVDFVTEKMLLREDGSLEQISEDEAQKLMNTDKETLRKYSKKFQADEFLSIEKMFMTQQKRFKEIASKVKILCKICKVFNNYLVAGNINSKENLNCVRPKSPQDIPDIVNSTFTDSNKNIFVKETQSKYIVPEPISVCIRNEVKDKEKQPFESQLENFHLSETDAVLKQIMNNAAEHTASGNPFVDVEIESNYTKQNNVFITSEYEADYSQTEEEPEAPIKIVVHQDSASPADNNPFIPEDYINMERPKTPVLKIITGDVKNREDSLYVDPKIAKTLEEDILGNEFINPFFMHQHNESTTEAQTAITDFLIGAPVSLPPILRAPTPEPRMDFMIVNGNDISTSDLKHTGTNDNTSSVFSTPLHTYLSKKDISVSSTFHSLDSNLSENIVLHNEANIAKLMEQNKNVIHKDTWDSAYVSIDDIASSPDSNNNDNLSSRESPTKSKTGFAIKNEELLKMGPAEKEIWQSCYELKNVTVSQAEIPNRVHDKRVLFTPIIEESIAMGTPTKKYEINSMTMAFGERNSVYNKYYPLSDSNSSNHTTDDSTGDKSDVDSASESKADVKRQTKKFLEGEISEIQPQVTESISVSRTLRSPDRSEKENKDKQSNIVLEKKLYWDKRIKEIEAKAAENNAQQKRRRLSAKYLRNDSLTKRRGKQIVKTILNKDISHKPTTTNKTNEVKISEDTYDSVDYINDDTTNDEKLVEKWKKYWDSKLETEKDLETNSVKFGSPKNQAHSHNFSEHKSYETSSILPVKQELPEEVFKAFETSPKRFFGTSRKQILNKIDTFLGKENTVNDSLPEVRNSSKETGLVSSRISLFHNISHTEEVPWSSQKKSKSMHDISQRKNSGTTSEKVQRSQPTTPEPIKTIVKTKEKFSSSADTQSCPSIKEKRAKFGQSKIISRTFDEHRREPNDSPVNIYCKHQDFNIPTNINRFYPTVLRKTTLSKSEMDIFTKRTNTVTTSDCLDRYQSCVDLPKVNVKNFISLYETVSKCSIESKKPRKMSCSSLGSQKNLHSLGSLPETARSMPTPSLPMSRDYSESPKTEEVVTPPTTPSLDCDLKQDNDSGIQNTTNTDDDRHSYISLSDMDIEIIENSSPDKSMESTPERETEAAHIEYKSRFKMAKQFFKSLEEIRDEKRPKKLNECEQMLYSKSTDESLETKRPPNRVKNNIKSNSVSTSKIAKAWEQLNVSQNENKLVKISEKFNVDDLFSDVVEGKLSRQGSLRGIPHKKAVLETFKSMDNLTDKNISAYEIVVSQLKDFSKENRIQNAQTYLSEYPYLPTTDPSKYHSRMDANASGLISLKDILNQKKVERQNKPRRNSVPDIRLNPNFTVQL